MTGQDNLSHAKTPDCGTGTGRPLCRRSKVDLRISVHFRWGPGGPFPMPVDVEESGFLSRWSRRKVLVRQGAAVAEPEAPIAVLPVLFETEPPLPLALAHLAEPAKPGVPDLDPAPALAPPQPPEAPPPSMLDVAALGRDSDYTRFLRPSVQPEVKNAALAKLFTDPHFNVMDRLDVYIDDYGKPDPLPPGMLRQMLQSHALGLFNDEDEECPPATAATPAPEAVPPTELIADENPALQLQPDDAAGRPGLEPGAIEDAGRQH